MAGRCRGHARGNAGGRPQSAQAANPVLRPRAAGYLSAAGPLSALSAREDALRSTRVCTAYQLELAGSNFFTHLLVLCDESNI